MLKIYLKFLLQKLLGFDNYLFVFSLFTINRHRLHFQDRDFYRFLHMIPENGNILDIGSNIGIMAVPIAKRVSSGRVFCFEPIPLHIKILKKVIRHYQLNNIEVFETALGEKNGELTMIMPEFYKVKFQGFSHVVEKETDKIKGEIFTVPSQRLDDIRAIQEIPKIDAIKIDVENFEYPVLLGAKDLLRRHKPLIYCELWDNEKRSLSINYLKNDLDYSALVFVDHKWVDYLGQQVSNFLFVQGSVNQNLKSFPEIDIEALNTIRTKSEIKSHIGLML
jgi:FkbM family methyltransferase